MVIEMSAFEYYMKKVKKC